MDQKTINIIISVLLGIGLASFFKKTCYNECVVVEGQKKCYRKCK